MIEAHFNLAKIKTCTLKFYQVFVTLPPELVSKLQPNILQAEHYEKLKEAVIRQHKKSMSEMLNKLMSSSVITGKLSLYLHELMTLAMKIGISNDIIRHKFIQIMSINMRLVLAA